MSGTSTIPAYTGGSRVSVERRGGLGSLVLIAFIGVLAIGVLALVMGFTGSNDFIDNIREKVPGLGPSESDGWMALDDPAGGFIVDMPEDHEKKFVSFAAAANGRLDQWASSVGAETELSVSYGKVTVADGQSPEAALVAFSEEWAAGLLGKVETTTDTTFRGYNAVELTVRDFTFADETATSKAMMVLKGDTLYVIQSKSVYSDHPQYGRLLGSFQFTAA